MTWNDLAIADQSVVHQNLDYCTTTTVSQREVALTEIHRHFSRGYHHNYSQQLQLLDLDFTELPWGFQSGFASATALSYNRVSTVEAWS